MPTRGAGEPARASGGPLAIGIDVGGTKIAGGVVDRDGTVQALARVDTPAPDADQTRDRIIDMVRELAGEHPVAAVGIGAAGWVDADRVTVRLGPHLAWNNQRLGEQVAAAVGLPVVVDNDANAAGWAEYQFGAGRGHDPMLLVTVGTGLGGGWVVNGELVRGRHGYAGEPGHLRAVPDGPPCGCGRRGCLELYASGRALVRYAQQSATADPGAAAVLLGLAGSVDQITGPLVASAAQAGDKLASEAFAQVGQWLGSGLADLAQLFDPALLVIGGGVADAGELLLAPTREAYAQQLGRRSDLPFGQIRPAQLGNLAGVVGAADLARRAGWRSAANGVLPIAAPQPGGAGPADDTRGVR